MKIRKVSGDSLPKALALLKWTFEGSNYEVSLVEKLHKNGKPIDDWVCIHQGKAIAYLAFTKAYNGDEVCGLHLGPVAVNPEFQYQGVGSELIRFALRQEIIKSNTIYVYGKPQFYKRFGFELCENPRCPFDKNNRNFLSLGDSATRPFTVGYEKEFG